MIHLNPLILLRLLARLVLSLSLYHCCRLGSRRKGGPPFSFLVLFLSCLFYTFYPIPIPIYPMRLLCSCLDTCLREFLIKNHPPA
ncbi:hypothetical protein QBC40DRAFT_52516 [Triangularia verruculosa]|uniref:Uncharacterized protein n=1 Tax=Triangularia verruculosa TaxID=2587418 RepID=A0AAN6XJ45_9PEZI|nr:hypothetical protein QBC40DRAFT_52516 [Triangularia verruculosa]